MVVIRLFPDETRRLVTYLAISVLSASLLLMSHEWVNATSETTSSSLPPSFAYALSTLYFSIGAWGSIVSAIHITVAEKHWIVCYAIGGIITLFCTVAYGVQTRHNVLLDIASCATTLGLTKDDVTDAADSDNGEPESP